MSSSRSFETFKAPTNLVYPDSMHPFEDLPLELVQHVGEDGVSGIDSYFNHFTRWEGPVAEGSASGWLLSGTTGAATVALSTATYGAIVLTADSTSGCNPTLGWATTHAPFLYVVGKRMWCFARLKVGTVASTEMFFGMGTPDTSPSVTGTFPSDGIFFHKTTTATKLSFDARKDGTSTSKASVTGTLVDDTYTIIGFRVGSTGAIMPYQDQIPLLANVIVAGTANIPVAGDVLAPMIGILGASQICTLDWVLFAQER